jgi:hypothetical protein
MAAEHQKELFEEFKKEKRKIDKIADKIKHRKKLYLHVPVENMVFVAIVVIMCAVVAFALGVERGKRYAGIRTAPESEPLGAKALMQPIELESIEVSTLTKKRPAVTERDVTEGIAYTIQLISYRKKEYAENEREKLLKKGIDAFIVSSGNWHQVCAGVYDNIQDAKEAQSELSENYKGCFIRRR